MSESSLPAPLVPSAVDLRDFRFMPLEVGRLMRSKAWLMAKRMPELGFYMVNLWSGAWHEVPAGSLEDDDDVLADVAKCDPARWAELRAKALHGWVKCADGRLYHPVVAEKVRDAWQAKLDQRQRTHAARQARARRRLGEEPERATEPVTPSVTDTKGQGQGERQGNKEAEADAIAACHGALRRHWADSGADCLDLPCLAGSTGAIRAWLREGAELERDILPTIESVCLKLKRRAQRPRSFNLFTQDIAAAMRRNTSPLPESPRHEHQHREQPARTSGPRGLSAGQRTLAELAGILGADAGGADRPRDGQPGAGAVVDADYVAVEG